MGLSRQNQQMLVSLLFCAVLAVIVGYLIQTGVGTIGEKDRVMEIADALGRCSTQGQYLSLLEQHYPTDSPIWQSPAMSDTASAASVPAHLEQLRDGRLKVSVAALAGDRLLKSNSYVYIPTILLDERGRGYRLDDVRLNSRQTDIVFEYYYRYPRGMRVAPDQRFRFFMGKRQWELQPVAATRR